MGRDTRQIVIQMTRYILPSVLHSHFERLEFGKFFLESGAHFFKFSLKFKFLFLLETLCYSFNFPDKFLEYFKLNFRAFISLFIRFVCSFV